MTPEERLGKTLLKKGLRIAVAETTTGGLISHLMIRQPGSSNYFERGMVAYSRESKLDLPGISVDMLDRFGSVSKELSIALAAGVRQLGGADIGIAETGIAGPTSGRSPKPLGTSHIALRTTTMTRTEEHRFQGDRIDVQTQIAGRAIEMVLEYLEEDAGEI